VLVRAVHARGRRARAPLVEVDCGALPDALVESELFGHERGAFTDARARKEGLLEVAHHGTVYLDEIGELSLAAQAKLLRAVEDRRFRRVGGVEPIEVDVAIVAATHRDLAEEVRRGRFRADLYYRLDVVRITVPPLRDRASDVPLLVGHLLAALTRTSGRPAVRLDDEAMAVLRSYAWPGNVRQLRNVLERIVLLGRSELVGAADLPPELRLPPADGEPGRFALPPEGLDLHRLEEDLVRQALDRTVGNQSAAARLLGLSRHALHHRVEKYRLR